MTEIPLPPELIMDLYESYNDLLAACQQTRLAIQADADGYPVYLPTHDATQPTKHLGNPHSEAIASITQVHTLPKGQSLHRAGLLCASPKTVTTVEALNLAKDYFKSTVIAIRDYAQINETSASRITSLVRDQITERGYRTPQLQQAMSTTGINTIDLKRAYAHIRIIEANLESFSWTWATTHSRIQKITMDQAVELATNLQSPETSQVALSLLGQCKPSQEFAIRRQLPNQLRANYVYKEDGQKKRKSCPISGIVLIQQDYMPKKLWRDDPGDHPSPRLAREQGIEKDVFIKALDLHRYL